MATTREQVEVPRDPIEKLTDKAITKEVAKLRRMTANREADRDALDNEIGQLRERCNELIKAQIERLEAQLPASKPGEDEDK